MENSISLASYKRLYERKQADPLNYPKIEIDSEAKEYVEKEYKKNLDAVYNYMDEKYSFDKIKNEKFRSWFIRQQRRIKFQSSILRHMKGLYYVPVTFELSDGCSVGCDFCCLEATALKSVFRYTEDNKKLWNEILDVTEEILGKSAGTGMCYFATEPFDNPDYQYFIEDHKRKFGYLPQTTTAVAHLKSQKIKEYMDFLGEEELRNAALRFSITNLAQLEKIYDIYTEEELCSVELLMNNKESSNCYSYSGRARNLKGMLKDKQFLENVSSACTNGFIVNMVKKSVMLVSVCMPDELHPKGMKVLDEKRFIDSNDYRMVLYDFIDKWMYDKLDYNKPVYLEDYITCEWLDKRLKIKGDNINRNISIGEEEKEGFKLLLEEHMDGVNILKSVKMTDFSKLRFKNNIDLFYESGYLKQF